MKKAFLFAIAAGFILASCTNKSGQQNTSGKAVTDYELKEIWKTDTVFKTPESVIYDETRDVIYVSNVNGNPSEKDLNGFISRMSTSGEITDLEWIKGLSGPKGMGIYGNLLYVTDITDLVIIDLDQAKIIESIPVAGAVFLNDISIDMTGLVYITDSRTGKIHTYKDGKMSEWVTGLTNPNGLYAEESRILLLTSAFNSVDPATGAVTMLTDSIGHGDGVEFTGIPGYYLVSDWTGEVFLVYPDHSKKSLLKTRDQKKNTADIGFIKEEMTLLVPTFFGNSVEAYELVSK
jgi:DNA-binding beta-propeller fold protein YncE